MMPRFNHLRNEMVKTWHQTYVLCKSSMCLHVCFHHHGSVYLNENKEMWVALHLPACKLQTVFLFPAVMLIAREALRELQAGRKLN